MSKQKRIDPTFGRRLRELREAAGLTQAELGVRVGMQQNTVARLELAKREPGWGTVLRLADALEADVGAFRGPGDNQPAEPEDKPTADPPRARGKRT